MRLFIVTLLLSTMGCAGHSVMHLGPCDAVQNREDVQVCGKREVLKGCRQAAGRSEYVCTEL